MSTATIYGNNSCAYCAAARMLLTKKGVAFEDVLVHNNADKLNEMRARSGRTSVPQVFIGDTHIGGFDELSELDKNGELDNMLTATQHKNS